jgi:hypothetical protein
MTTKTSEMTTTLVATPPSWCSRRALLLRAVVAMPGAYLALLAHASAAHAAKEQALSIELFPPDLSKVARQNIENLADLAEIASAPGSKHLRFPAYMLGEWDVARDLYSVAAPDAETPAVARLKEGLGRRYLYRIRFVEPPSTPRDKRRRRPNQPDDHGRDRGDAGNLDVDGHLDNVDGDDDGQDDHRYVVEDRKFNYKQELMHRDKTTTNVTVTWDMQHADTLTATCASKDSRLTREIKFTDRSVERAASPAELGTFTTTEDARVVDIDTIRNPTSTGLGPIPSVYRLRQIIRYRIGIVGEDGLPEEMKVKCIEELYPPAPEGAQPFATLKYRMFLTRKGRRNRIVKSNLAMEKALMDAVRTMPSK